MADNGIETTTWHDQRPTHRKVPKAVLEALEYATNCAHEFNEELNKELNKGSLAGRIEWTEINRLANKANDAEDALDAARELALNPEPDEECSCGHDPNREDAICPVCVEANRQKYGDDIPIGGE